MKLAMIATTDMSLREPFNAFIEVDFRRWIATATLRDVLSFDLALATPNVQLDGMCFSPGKLGKG